MKIGPFIFALDRDFPKPEKTPVAYSDLRAVGYPIAVVSTIENGLLVTTGCSGEPARTYYAEDAAAISARVAVIVAERALGS